MARCGGCRRATRATTIIEFQGAPPRYVEVKGTTRALPHFFMSEGERPLAPDHADRYSLLIVHAIDLEAETGQLLLRDGAVDGADLSPPRHLGSALAERLS